MLDIVIPRPGALLSHATQSSRPDIEYTLDVGSENQWKDPVIIWSVFVHSIDTSIDDIGPTTRENAGHEWDYTERTFSSF